MGLKEIAIGGIYFGPLLFYALFGALLAFVLRSLLHRLVGQQILWFEAWFDVALFVIAVAAIAFLFSLFP
jgi:ABC-type antimicrobial peptide transport system permease subunit